MSPLWGFQLLQRLKVPHSYLWSQTLIPKPADWPAHLNVTGFSFLKADPSYTPPDDLVAFLENGPTPIYVGFGSIVVDNPLKLTELIFEAIKLAGVRAIVSKGWGGIGTGKVPENVYMIGNCPHDWLFRNVSCVVHHGGAGTTAAGIALGRPTVIVPFFGDQPFWGQMIAKAGAGPKPIPFKKLTATDLAESIKFALRPEVGVAVKDMASRIAKEDGASETVRDFERALNVDEMRCHICPDRLAVWEDKRSGVHLSGLAMAILVQQGFIDPKDLQLLRHRHWYTHEGAEVPIIGAAAAVSGFFTSVATNTSDFSHRLKRETPESNCSTPTQVDPLKERVQEQADEKEWNSVRLSKVAERMAYKSFKGNWRDSLDKDTSMRRTRKLQAFHAAKAAERGRAHVVTSATLHYAGDLAKTSLQAPVALFYNSANGFRNAPSYLLTNEGVRRRDEIVGCGSGLEVAGKEFVIGMFSAFIGLVRHPYVGTKVEGPLGLVKGVGRGLGGFPCHILGAVLGILGYSLKGIECELSKGRLTSLQAELYLIRLRQAVHDLRTATQEEKEDIVVKWKAMHGHK